MATVTFMSEGPFSYLTAVTSATGIPVVTSVSAEQYLTYAKEDISNDSDRGTINALGNAKRALFVMIDKVLQNYGMLEHNRGANFPDKLKLLDDVGLIALNVFKNLNVERNIAEHEYRVPQAERVQDFIDVCHLLQLALSSLGRDIPYRSIVGLQDSGEHAMLVLEAVHGRLDFYPLLDPEVETAEHFGRAIDHVWPNRYRGSEETGGADVALEPSRSIDIRWKNKDDWVPIIECFVGHNNRESTHRRTTVTSESVTIWRGVEIPAEAIAKSSLAQMLGFGGPFAARTGRPERQSSSAEHDPDGQEPA